MPRPRPDFVGTPPRLGELLPHRHARWLNSAEVHLGRRMSLLVRIEPNGDGRVGDAMRLDPTLGIGLRAGRRGPCQSTQSDLGYRSPRGRRRLSENRNCCTIPACGPNSPRSQSLASVIRRALSASPAQSGRNQRASACQT